jgi:hypothetical protein
MARHQRLENIPDGPRLTTAFIGQDSLDGAIARHEPARTGNAWRDGVTHERDRAARPKAPPKILRRYG